MCRDLEDVLREIGELSNIHADRKKLRANLREIRDHRLAYYNQSNEKELQAEFSDALFKILLLELDEEEEESIEIAELAYLGLGHIFRRPELPTPELYKRRLLLLHYFCDYFTDSLQISGGQHITGEKSGYRMSGEDAVVGYVLSGRKCNRFYRRR